MKNLQYIIIAFSIISIFSCGDKFINDIDIEVPEADLKMVINLELNAGDTIANTFVARNANITEAEHTFYDDAIVELYKEDNLLTILDYNIETNEYSARLDPSELTVGDYRVEVSGVDGLDDISSTQTIPPKVNLVNGTYQEDGTIEAYYGYAYSVDEAKVTIDDPADQENYYQVKLFGVTEDLSGNIIAKTEFFITSLNPLVEGGFYLEGLLLNDDSFNGNEFELSIGFSNYFTSGYSSDEEVKYLVAELNNISRDNYLYQLSLNAFETSIGNPFAEPVVVHNNIDNGIGIFRSRNASEYRIDF